MFVANRPPVEEHNLVTGSGSSASDQDKQRVIMLEICLGAVTGHCATL